MEFNLALKGLTGLAASTHSLCCHLQDVCHWVLQMLTGNNTSKWLYCQSTVSLKMMSLVARHSNFYKGDVEMGFAVMCSSTHEVFIHVLEYCSVLTVYSAVNI